MITSSSNNDNNRILLFLIYFPIINLITINAFPLPSPELTITSNASPSHPLSLLSSPFKTTINSAEVQFTNPKKSPTMVEGVFKFKAIKITSINSNKTDHDESDDNDNKTLITGQINTGIFDPVATNYMIYIVDRSKNLIFDLTSENNLIVEIPGIKCSEHVFDVNIDSIVNQLLQISHRTEGIIGVGVIKEN